MTVVDLGLNAEQEAFCRAYAAKPNGAAAARAAYHNLAGAHSDVASERGRKLLRLEKIQRRVAELQGCAGRPRMFAGLGELERIAAVALDDAEPDLNRLLALKALGAGLAEIRAQRRAATGEASQVVVRIEIRARP